MEQHPLRPALEQLHDELERANTADPNHDLLQELQRDTRSLLDRIDRSEDAAPHPDFADRLGDAMLRFELSHPMLTAAMQQAVDALNRIGI